MFAVKRASVSEALDRLSELENPPESIFHRGVGLSELDFSGSVAIVGSREVSEEGLIAAFDLGRRMAEEGRIVVSGLALGIDTAAFEGALSSEGVCVAVLPSGVDEVYPRSNESLADRILSEGGSIVSEYPDGTAPRRFRFVERNRIIAALSDTVVLCEARPDGGAWHTVRASWLLGRETLLLGDDGETRPLEDPQRKLF